MPFSPMKTLDLGVDDGIAYHPVNYGESDLKVQTWCDANDFPAGAVITLEYSLGESNANAWVSLGTINTEGVTAYSNIAGARTIRAYVSTPASAGGRVHLLMSSYRAI